MIINVTYPLCVVSCAINEISSLLAFRTTFLELCGMSRDCQCKDQMRLVQDGNLKRSRLHGQQMNML